MPRRGENIRKRKDNRWEGRYIKSRTSTGKAIYGSVYGKTYSIVKEKLKSISTEEKEFSKGDNFTFKEALLFWLDSNKIKQKVQTYNKYLRLIETQIIPGLGSVKLSQLNYCMINQFIAEKSSNGRLDKTGGLSASYIQTICFIIDSTIRFCVDNGFCAAVYGKITRPIKQRKEIKVLSFEEQKLLEKSLLTDINENKVGMLISLYAGLRIGEVCGLRWKNIDFERSVIYQSTKSGYCDCCGFEFTDSYINQIVSAKKEKQKEIQKKIAEENRQRQLLIEKEEREKLTKAKAEKKARLEAEKAYRKERNDREKVVSRIEKNNKRYEKGLKFSLGFKKFRKAMSALGIILVILSAIGSVVFLNELGVDFIVPQNVIADKIETIKDEHLISVKFDEKQNILKKSKDTEDTIKLSKGSIRLFNSITSLISNQSTIEEKLMYMFPRSTDFVNEFLESSKETESMTEKNEDFSEKNEQID